MDDVFKSIVGYELSILSLWIVLWGEGLLSRSKRCFTNGKRDLLMEWDSLVVIQGGRIPVAKLGWQPSLWKEDLEVLRPNSLVRILYELLAKKWANITIPTNFFKLRRVESRRFTSSFVRRILAVSKLRKKIRVYALWKVPDLLPAFILKGGEVSRFVIGGADLMFPGISIPAEGLPSFAEGEPWAVKVPGNPAPIAVGTTTMSSTAALKAGLRGKALRITHYYRDSLWQELVEGHYVPNAGFLEDVVFEDPSLSSACQASDSCEGVNEASSDPQNDISNKKEGESVDVLDLTSEANPSSTAQLDVSNDPAEQITANVDDLKVTDEESNVEVHHTLSTEDVDALLDKCLLQALHTTVKDKDLPMPGSTLWYVTYGNSCA
ncbi:Eukaryotic translation initiation factor 2D [Vitis vinifera]|uniref:Eukaryotic translation initiation factor 2D n=1 Tax=Vitis vinifera TaxID=29760 RepID=A0A438FJB8_VITVI|nr:Eukaryotic translation initiation factor 2D [Vitis vinifera]